MAQPEQSNVSVAEQIKAARATIDYASSLTEWVNQMPQPESQTAERTFNEVLGEVVGELARIRNCYNFKTAKNELRDASIFLDPDAEGYDDQKKWIQQGIEAAEDGLKSNNCPKS